MSARTHKIGRTALAAVAAPLALGAVVVAPASTAQAHDDVTTTQEWRDTSDCWCELYDEWDGTFFQHDAGGEAQKTRIYSGGQLVGKVEFHPYDEKVWVYDTVANGDALYVKVFWEDKYEDKVAYLKVPSGSRHSVSDLSIPEGTQVNIRIYDDGWGDDLIAHPEAIA